MELHIREQLADLAERLHLHKGSGEERARELHDDVRSALDEDEHQGLHDRLNHSAVDFEIDHPDLAMALRRVADAISAAGI